MVTGVFFVCCTGRTANLWEGSVPIGFVAHIVRVPWNNYCVLFSHAGFSLTATAR
jgi:hypothetical protein